MITRSNRAAPKAEAAAATPNAFANQRGPLMTKQNRRRGAAFGVLGARSRTAPRSPRGLLSAWLLSTGVLLTGAGSVGAAETLIRARAVHPVSGPVLRPGAVLVKDGRIAAVAGKLDAPAGAAVIEVPGELTPGLIDPFTQQGVAGSASEVSEEIAPAWRVSRALDRRALAWKAATTEGVTTVGLFPGSDSVWAGQGAVVGVRPDGPVVEKDEAGVLLVISSDPASRNSSRGRPDSIYNRLPTNRMGVIWMARRTLSAPTGALARDGGVIQDVLEGRRRLFVLARTEYDLDAADRLATEYKLKPILVGGQEAWRMLPKLKERKYPIILPTVAVTQGQGAIGPEGTELNWNNAGLLVEAGVPVAFAGGGLLDKARFSARHGMTKAAALEALTRRPAELLGIAERVGAIEVGKGADLAAFSGDPLEPTSAVLWTMKGGAAAKP